VLGLPGDVEACLFDLDGVLTLTAAVHREAWQEVFNECLRRWQLTMNRWLCSTQSRTTTIMCGQSRRPGCAGRCAVSEDAVAGVAAGRAGGFGLLVGVDRVGHAEDLRRGGADLVVGDPIELLEAP